MIKKALSDFSPDSTLILLLVFLLGMAGCAATKVTGIWKDPAYQGGSPKNVLIIGVSKPPTVRKVFESEFAKRFKARGVSAVESFRLLPTDDLEGNEARELIVAKITELGIDAVFMVQSAGTRKVAEYMPGVAIYSAPFGSYGAWGSYYSMGAAYPAPATSPGSTHERKYISMESHLYDVKTGKLIWSALTETYITGSPTEEIIPYISIITNKLVSARLLP